MRPIIAIAWFAVVASGLILDGNLSAATVPVGFTQITVSGPWPDAVGITFEDNGRMYVWERTGKVWFKDPGDPLPSLLLDISEEVGAWQDHGMLGFALDPNFRVNGYIYVLYVVDRYYLLHFGDPNYDPAANEYNAATIGRLTRYTCWSSDSFRSVDPASRQILIGETKQTGFPICSYTHGVGSLVFGEDGTLLVSCGDGATADTVDQGGNISGSYAPQALTDGILRAKEDIGALRSQLLDSLNGKVLRIDPATGDGLPSNPYYDAANPRSARSRVWALGLRNPFRMSLRPDTGSHFPPDGNPGVLYVGDLGWNTWESVDVITGPRQNFGWPLFEGLDVLGGDGYDGNVANQDAPNPLYPGAGCSQYFSFRQLLHEDTLNPAGQPPFPNPCDTSQMIPSSIPQFLHTRPVLDWNHNSAITRTPIYGGSGQAQTANVGAPGSPVSGTPFSGNCGIGGTWYTGTNFPTAYQNRYYFADWAQGFIKTLTFDANDKPLALGDFVSNAGAIVKIEQHPIDGSLYYITYNSAAAEIDQLTYTGNRTPIAVASADRYYGPTPLAVQFSSNGSYDPDANPITYSWNFGDGSPVSTQANPAHTFTAPAGVPTEYVVTLTVTDSGNLSAQATLIVSVNNTPPNVTITSPVDHTLYSPFNQTTVNLTATVSDAESSDAQLSYQWQVLLHHNDHNHPGLVSTNHSTTAVLEPTGCDGINIYYYRILLTVTDPAGLATTREVRVYPDCGPNTPPTISSIADQSILQDHSTGPIAFTVGDAEMAPTNLQLSAGSSNAGLVPIGNIVFGGSGANRAVTVTPAAGQTGSATITVTVTVGPNDTSTNFVVTVSPAPPPPSLVAAYGFNEGNGTVVSDVSGNGNNGTISGATWTSSGKYGNALSFNGTNALVTINNATSLQLTSAMTLEAWVYPTAVNSAWRDVIYKGNDNYYLEGTSANSSRPAMGGTFASDLYGTSALTANTWAHLAATYDGATMRLYVNGVQVSSRAQTGTIATSTNPLQIGGDSIYGQYFAGRIDEVRIYNRALSAAEIQNDMNTALSPAPPDTQPPSAPGNLVATTLGVSQVNLSWTASTDNVGVTGYLVERQDPGSQSFVQVGTSIGTSYNDTGLAAGSTYSYRVRATDAAQNLSQYSGVASVTTQTGPAASDNFNRVDGGLGVNWAKPVPASEQTLVIVGNQVTPNIEDAHCYAYWIGNTFSQDQYSQVQISNVGPWSGVIVRAQSAIDRFYIAFVFGPNDYRLYLRKDGLYYSLSTGTTQTWITGDIIRLEASGLNPVQLRLLRNGNSVLTYTDATENLVGGSPGIGIYSPSGDHLAIDNWEGGNLGLMGTLGSFVPETQELSVRGNLVGTALGVSEIKLSWTASTDKVGVKKYEVQRQDSGSASFVRVGTTTGTSYVDTGLAEGNSYSYRVLVRDAKGSLKNYSGVASVTTASPTIVHRRSR